MSEQRRIQSNQITLSLDGLSDVAVTNPVSSQILTYSGTQWKNTSTTSGTTPAFSGATVVLTNPFFSKQTVAVMSGTSQVPAPANFLMIPFNHVLFDTQNWYSPPSGTRTHGTFYVPSNVQYARFTASVRWDSQTILDTSKLYLMLFKDNSSNIDKYFATELSIADRGGAARNISANTPSFRGNNLYFDSGWIEVSSGQRYDIRVTHFQNANNILITDAWFNVETRRFGAPTSTPPSTPTQRWYIQEVPYTLPWDIDDWWITVEEDVGQATLRVKRALTTTQETVYVSIVDSTNTWSFVNRGSLSKNEGDYTPFKGIPLTFEVGEDNKPFSVTVLQDNKIDTVPTSAAPYASTDEWFQIVVTSVDPNVTTPTSSLSTAYFIINREIRWQSQLPSGFVDSNVGSVTLRAYRTWESTPQTLYAKTYDWVGYSSAGIYVPLDATPLVFAAGQSAQTTPPIQIVPCSIPRKQVGFSIGLYSDPACTRGTEIDARSQYIEGTWHISTNSPRSVLEQVGTVSFTISRLVGTEAATAYIKTAKDFPNDASDATTSSSDVHVTGQPFTLNAGELSKTYTLTWADNSVIQTNRTYYVVILASSTDTVDEYIDCDSFTIVDDDIL